MDLKGRILNNRFKIEREITQGRTSNIYCANDLNEKGKLVSVKFLNNRAISARTESHIRFRSEINSMLELDHENIVKVYNIGEIIGLQYIVTEYIQGQNLSNIIKNETISTDRCLDIIIQTCRALEYIHRHKIIHRDLKPGNILVEDKRIVVSDTGLAHIKEFNEEIPTGNLSETFGYLSPEQSGVMEKSVDERSDLFSLGVIFYQMLTGKLPFVGDDINSLVHQQVAKIPEKPASINPDIPEIIENIILKLLKKEPENRYQSARGLLFDLEKISKGQKEIMLGLNDSITRLSFRTKLVGRDDEFDSLKIIFNQTLEGNGGLCFISGEAGSGKTRLAEELKDYVFSKKRLVVDGKCSIQSKKIPFEPFKDALNGYMNYYKDYPEFHKKEIVRMIKQKFGDLGEIIIKLNPAMKEIFGECPPLVALEPERENKRFHYTVGHFFQTLADIENGMVILIDDLQWTDDGTLTLLHELLYNISEHSLLLIGTFRDDEISEDHTLKKFMDNMETKDTVLQEIILKSFNLKMMNSFISGLLVEPQDNTNEIAEFILAKSNGNPFFTIEILKQLIDEKALYYDEDRWNIDQEVLNQIEVPSSIVDIIFKRTQSLNTDEKELLSCAAVIGDKFYINLLCKLSELDSTSIVNIVDKAIDLNLLSELPVWGKVGFAHDRIRDAFYDSIDEEKKKRLHLSIASTIEEINSSNIEEVIFELAYHFVEGGNNIKSLEYAFPAAMKAKANYANEEALKYYKLSASLLEQNGQKYGKRWIEAFSNIGEIYLTVGRYDDSIELYDQILPILSTDMEKIKAYGQICTAYFKKGDWKKCEEFGLLGLKLLGERLKIIRINVILGIFKEFLIHIIRTLFTRAHTQSKEGPKVDHEKYKAQFALPVLWSYVLSDIEKFIRFELRALNLAESKMGKSKELAMAIGGYASLLMAIPFFRKAIKYHDRALTMKEELNDRWGAAQSLQFLGFCYQWMGEYKKSIDYFRESAARFREIGDIREFGMSRAGIVHCLYFLSDYEHARIVDNEYFNIAKRTNDNYGTSVSWSWSTKYYVESGDYKNAEIVGLKSFKLSHKSKIWFVHCEVNIALGSLYLETGDLKKALEHLEKAKELFENNFFLEQYTVHLYPIITEVYLAVFLSIDESENSKRKLYLKKVNKYRKYALRKTKNWITYYGAALRINAKYYALINKSKKAEKLFLRSIEISKKLGRRYEVGKSYYDYGMFLSESDELKRSRKCLETAFQIFNDIGSKEYIERCRNLLGIREEIESTSIERLVDKERTSTITKLAREIRLIPNIDEMLNRVLTNAIKITGAQRGCIFIVNEKNELENKVTISFSEPNINDYSITVVKTVFKNNNTMIIDDAEKEDGSIVYTGKMAHGLKSILCVPINEGSKTIGVCYLDNSLSSGVFTERNADLLLSFLSQVALVLEIEFLHQRIDTDTDSENKKQPYISDLSKEKIKKAIEYIDENFTSEISREGLAAYIDVHPDNLGRYFKIYLGKRMSEYINKLRINEAAKMLLVEKDKKIIDIAFSVGFGSLKSFNQAFLEFMKVNPSKYRKLNKME